MGARYSAVLAVALALTGAGARAADEQIAACKVIDDAGGSNHLVITLRDDRVHAFRYRRSEGLPRCEIEAGRSPPAEAWERFEWTGSEAVSEVRLYSDNQQDAHVRITRRDRRIELRILDYDRPWLCGLGQRLNPVIVLDLDQDRCGLLALPNSSGP